LLATKQAGLLRRTKAMQKMFDPEATEGKDILFEQS